MKFQKIKIFWDMEIIGNRRKIPIFSGWNFAKMQLCAMIASHCDGILEQWVENCCSVLLQSSIESKLRALNSQRFTVWCPDFIDMKSCFYSNLSIFQRFAGYANQNRFFLLVCIENTNYFAWKLENKSRNSYSYI